VRRKKVPRRNTLRKRGKKYLKKSKDLPRSMGGVGREKCPLARKRP